MKYDMILTYMPPLAYFSKNNLCTWPKVFIIKKADCHEELDFKLKINELKKQYHMLDKYIKIAPYNDLLFLD